MVSKFIMPNQVQILTELIETVHRLRAPGGCPWDRAQTHQSLRPYVIEEAYEVLDVLDQISSPESLKNDSLQASFREELGDLLMQVVLHSEMTNESGAFNFYDVAQSLNEKLIRRHPHVFGELKANDVESAYQTWEKQKAIEKAKNPDPSVLAGLPKGLPALQRAGRVIEKVSKVGFQWSDLQGPLEKIEEELHEFKIELSAIQKNPEAANSEMKERLQSELGDLLFSLCNVGYFLKISPEDGLRSTLAKFEKRFRHVETRLREMGKTPEQSNLEEMDQYWNEAKAMDQNRKTGN
jgi:tetrapyrrole methylase family protein / MazG family protein